MGAEGVPDQAWDKGEGGKHADQPDPEKVLLLKFPCLHDPHHPNRPLGLIMMTARYMAKTATYLKTGAI